jgi:endonuclease YncB( thermonuclease family)
MVDNNGHYTKFRAIGVDTAETTYTIDNAARVIEQAGRGMPDGGDVIHEMKIGKEAKARLRTLSTEGNVIIVTENKSVIDKDRGKEEDRRYAQIIVNIDGQHVSWSEYMLANGLATVARNKFPVISPYTGEDLKPRYKKLEAHAKANRLGRYENLRRP